MGGLRLNLGCGPIRREGEIGVDAQPTEACDVRADILAVPFPDGAAEFVRLDHVLEHMPQRMAPRVLLEARRLLAPGGQLQVGVPDVRATFEAYIKDPDMGERLLYLRTVYGSQTHPGEFHQSGWDPETLHTLITHCGFDQVTVGPDIDEAVRVEGICITASAVKP